MNEIIKNYEQSQIQQILKNSKVTDFAPGDTVKVNVKIKEGNKERVQAFQGVCIGKKNNGLNSSFTVRKISSGEGVERVFPLYSNVIDSIERIKVGDVRRAKLYYLRELSGKKARIAERTDGRSYDDDQYISTIKDIEAAPEEQPAEETPAAEEAPVAAEEKVEAKIWSDHLVRQRDDGTSLLYIDRHLVHEVTSPQAFEGLKIANRSVHRPDATIAVADHNVPTINRQNIEDPQSKIQVETLAQNTKEHGIQYFDLMDQRQGIVHIIGPEQGITQPGMTIVCGDSHTSTHGAFGALAFGIGTSEVEHVLATQTIVQNPAKNMRISVNGELPFGVNSKDLIPKLIDSGFSLIATTGTAKTVKDLGFNCEIINKVTEGRPHIVDELVNKKVDIVINTTEGRQSIEDSASIRKTALQNKIFCTTTIFGAFAFVEALKTSREDWSFSAIQEIN